MSAQCKKSPSTRPMFMNGSKFREQFFKRVTYPRNIPAKLIQNRTTGFRVEEFLHGRIVQKVPPPPPPPHDDHVFWWIKISRTIFEKGHPRNNPVKLFQNLTNSFIREEFWRISVKSTFTVKQAGQDGPGSLAWILEITKAIFFGHFQRRIYKNFFMSVQCKQPPFTNTMFIDRLKFRKQFLKRVTQGTFLWNYFQIWLVLSEKVF